MGTGEFLAKEYVGYQLYFRAAVLNSDGQKSDYIPYFNNSKCGTFVEQGEHCVHIIFGIAKTTVIDFLSPKSCVN